MATDSFDAGKKTRTGVTVESLLETTKETQKTRRGRPPKYCPAIVDCICRALEAGATRTAAYGYVGIHKSTFLEWMDTKPEFSDQVEQAEAIAELRFTLIAHRGIENCTPEEAIAWLRRQRYKDWGNIASQESKSATIETAPDGTSRSITTTESVTQQMSFANDVLERFLLEKEALLRQPEEPSNDTGD